MAEFLADWVHTLIIIAGWEFGRWVARLAKFKRERTRHGA